MRCPGVLFLARTKYGVDGGLGVRFPVAHSKLGSLVWNAFFRVITMGWAYSPFFSSIWLIYSH